MDIEIFFGYKGLLSYHIGDKVQWNIGKSLKNGGRPKDGNIDDDGYTECPKCYKDFFVTVHVTSDIITAVAPNLKKQGFK